MLPILEHNLKEIYQNLQKPQKLQDLPPYRPALREELRRSVRLLVKNPKNCRQQAFLLYEACVA